MSWSTGSLPGDCAVDAMSGCDVSAMSGRQSGEVRVSGDESHSLCSWASASLPRGVPRGAAALAPGEFFGFSLKYRCMSLDAELERVTLVAALVLCSLVDGIPI